MITLTYKTAFSILHFINSLFVFPVSLSLLFMPPDLASLLNKVVENPPVKILRDIMQPAAGFSDEMK